MERRRSVKKTKNKRMGVNIANLCATVFMLGLAMATANAAFTNRIMDISSNLGRALNRAMELENTTYTPLPRNPVYNMNVTFSPKGMAGLYNITTFFMDLVQSKGFLPKDVELPENIEDVSQLTDKLPAILMYYAGILTLTILGLLFLVFMPLVGIVFCCCRCCGNCGARSQPFDKKHDMCRKILLATLLIGVATLILFGVVCAFVSNLHMQQGFEELPNDLRHALHDMSVYLDHTDAQINTIMVKNFDELSVTLITLLQGSSTIISDKLKDFANATSFTSLAVFVENLDNISEDLEYMKNSTNSLRVNVAQLSDGLRRVKNDLLHSLNMCTKDMPSKCSQLMQDVNALSTTVDFDKLPDVSENINKLSKILKKGDLMNAIRKGQKSFDKIQTDIAEGVDSNIPKVKEAILKTGISLQQSSSNVSVTLKKIQEMLGTDANSSVDDAEKIINEISKYRYYIGIAESTVLLLVILCVSFGLMCGICGKRPDGYDDDCCNKGAGSKFLMMGVGVMFFFSFFLMLLTLAYFLSGMIIQRLACDTLRNPDDNQLFSLLDKVVDINSIVPTNISSLIKECHQNESVYNILNLEHSNMIDINMSDPRGLLEKFGITEQINGFTNQIVFDKNITIIIEDTQTGIDELKRSGIGSISFDQFTRVMEHNITSINLNDMANQLDELSNMQGIDTMLMSLTQNAMYLRMYQKNLVDPMEEIAKELTIRALRIDVAIKMNNTNGFDAALDEVVVDIKSAETYINDHGADQIKEIAKEFSESFEEKLVQYVEVVATSTTTKVGKCGPISNVYNSTLVATCDKILNPWNGFWVCVGWCLILFIPAIVLSVKLATLYQKSDPYPGPLVEAVPHKKGKKKKRGGEANMYDTRGYSAGDTGRGPDPRAVPHRERDAPGGSSHPDTRYADMAPKHWEDYPNGGPPQYQSAPMATEYERPPPYYYPGPGDRP